MRFVGPLSAPSLAYRLHTTGYVSAVTVAGSPTCCHIGTLLDDIRRAVQSPLNGHVTCTDVDGERSVSESSAGVAFTAVFVHRAVSAAVHPPTAQWQHTQQSDLVQRQPATRTAWHQCNTSVVLAAHQSEVSVFVADLLGIGGVQRTSGNAEREREAAWGTAPAHAPSHAPAAQLHRTPTRLRIAAGHCPRRSGQSTQFGPFHCCLTQRPRSTPSSSHAAADELPVAVAVRLHNDGTRLVQSSTADARLHRTPSPPALPACCALPQRPRRWMDRQTIPQRSPSQIRQWRHSGNDSDRCSEWSLGTAHRPMGCSYRYASAIRECPCFPIGNDDERKWRCESGALRADAKMRKCSACVERRRERTREFHVECECVDEWWWRGG